MAIETTKTDREKKHSDPSCLDMNSEDEALLEK
jgi:hypothetical protein